jgi:hypothetical protein
LMSADLGQARGPVPSMAEAPSGPPRDVLAVDITFLFQATWRQPITGIAACAPKRQAANADAAPRR